MVIFLMTYAMCKPGWANHEGDLKDKNVCVSTHVHI